MRVDVTSRRLERDTTITDIQRRVSDQIASPIGQEIEDHWGDFGLLPNEAAWPRRTYSNSLFVQSREDSACPDVMIRSAGICGSMTSELRQRVWGIKEEWPLDQPAAILTNMPDNEQHFFTPGLNC